MIPKGRCYCIGCGGKAEFLRMFCTLECEVKTAKLWKVRREKGLCIVCGEERFTDEHGVCEDCLTQLDDELMNFKGR